jgi:hypothetical protein
MNLNFERNLTVLLNKMPQEKQIYDKLKNQKEGYMRAALQAAVPSKLRTWSGPFRNDAERGDIDLVLIDDEANLAVVLELKWFIAPGEIREVVEREIELEKGARQLGRIERALRSGDETLLSRLGINSSYEIKGILVSANWISPYFVYANNQTPAVPMMNQEHLVEALRAQDLSSVVAWVSAGNHLPRIDRDILVDKGRNTVGPWSVLRPRYEFRSKGQES